MESTVAKSSEEIVRDAVTAILAARDEKLLQEQEKRGNYKQMNVWASQIPTAHLGCWREVYYKIKDSQLPEPMYPKWPASKLARFEAGHNVEADVISDLYALFKRMDYTVEGGQTRFELVTAPDAARVYISGKVDFCLRIPGIEKPVPCDVKNFHPQIADRIQTPQQALENKWTSKAATQILVYAYANGFEIAILWLASLGSWRPIIFNLNDHIDYLDEIDTQAQFTMLCVDTESPPPFCTRVSECQSCWAKDAYCHPPLDFGPGAAILDDPELEAQLARSMEIEPLAKEHERLTKAIKERIPDRDTVMIGRFLYRQKYVTVKAQPEKVAPAKPAGGYWKREEVVDLEQAKPTEAEL
jgi:hypothetical protein